MSSIVSIAWILTILSFIKGQTLPEGNPDQATACADAVLRMACPSGGVIAVKEVRYGTKLTTTCQLGNTSDPCCQYDAGDCFDPPYSNTAEIAACSGYNVCNKDKADSNAVRAGQQDSSSCGADYPGLTHYLVMDYYCIPVSRIGLMSSASLQGIGSPLYIQNTDYPTGPIRAAETSASCSVETTSCSSQVKMFFVHFELSDGGGSCTGTQNLQVDDKDDFHTYTCSDNTDYTIKWKLTSSSNYLNLTLNNTDGTNDGKFKIGFEATDSTSPLTIKCPAENQMRCMDCPPLHNIPNGTVSANDGLSTGKTANYSCESEFDLLGNRTRTCLENGQWSGQAPSCHIKVCAPLPNPEHGTVIPTGESVGQTASYICDGGYLLHGNVSRTCQADTTWSGTEPTCVLIVCPALANPSNGIVETHGGFTVGQNATYECNYGYELQGENTRTCQSNATWDGNMPNCAAIVCPALSNPVNGTVRTDNGATVKQTAIYECNSGYSLSGDSSRTCQLNATWSGDEPTCVLIEACPALTSPENGQVSTDGNTIGSTATYSCSHGFIISNSSPRICQDGFTWGGTQPTCTKRKLGDPCTSESDCSDAIPESTCKNETCVCPEGSEVRDNLCVRSGESKPGGDDEMPTWGWILIGLGGFTVVVFIIAVTCFLQRRKDRQPKDDLDRCRMESENTNNMKKDKSNAFDNNLYQEHVNQTGLTERTPIKTSDEMINEEEKHYTNLKVVNEVGGTDENTIQKQKTEELVNKTTIEPPEAKDFESVMMCEHPKNDYKDDQEFNSNPQKHKEATDEKQNKLLEHEKTKELVNKTAIEPPEAKDFESVMMCEHPKNDYKDDQEFNSNSQKHKEATDEEQNKLLEHEKTEELVNKTTIEPPVDKDFESVIMCENPKNDYKDDQEFNSIPQKHKESIGEEQNKLPEHETIQDQNSSNDVLKHPEAANKDSIEAAEKEIKNAVKLDERFSEASKLITDVTSALFRSASKAKKDLVEKACITGFSFDTTEDGEWSKGLISAAKSVLAAIFSMCSIANEMVDGKASEEKMHAATKEVKRATNALVLSYHVEGYPESDSLQKLQTACDVVNKAAESLLASASLKSDTQPAKKKSIALDDNEVQKAMKRIEAQETVMRKQKELEEAQKAKALINEEQNRFQQETTAL